MRSAGDDQQLLIVALEATVGVFAHVAAMRLLAVNDEGWRAEVFGVREEGVVHPARHGLLHPPEVGVDRAGMIAARSLVVLRILADEGRLFARELVDGDGREGVFCEAGSVLAGAEVCDLLLGAIAVVGRAAVVVAPGSDAWHVVHGARHDGFDARIVSGSIERDAAPATDAEDADACGVDAVEVAEVVDGGLEVFRVDVEREDVARMAATLTRKRGVEGQRDEAALGECLCVKSAGLLLDAAEKSADGDGGQLARSAFGHVEIGGQGEAKMVVEGHLAVLHTVALGEHFVPFCGQWQSLIERGTCRFLCVHCVLCLKSE